MSNSHYYVMNLINCIKKIDLVFYYKQIKNLKMRIYKTKDELRTAIVNYFYGIDYEEDIECCDTSQITDMSELFMNIKHMTTRQFVLNWNTSNVTNMSGMFKNCTQSFILNFDTSNVTDMSNMFYQAKYYNQPLNFDTRNVINMSHMFYNATNFNQPLNFDTRNVTNMSAMFMGANSFNQPLYFDTHNVKNVLLIFCRAKEYNHPIYFINNYKHNILLFSNPALLGQEQKYLLSARHYYKLLLFYILNIINSELLLFCDRCEEFY